MYKKIALLLLFVTLLVVGYGIYVLLNKDQQGNSEVVVDDNQLIVKQLDNSKQNKIKASKPGKKARSKTQLERIVNQTITVKASKIILEAQDRPYNDDEVDFIGNPRQNIINIMFVNGELTEEEVQILNS